MKNKNNLIAVLEVIGISIPYPIKIGDFNDTKNEFPQTLCLYPGDFSHRKTKIKKILENPQDLEDYPHQINFWLKYDPNNFFYLIFEVNENVKDEKNWDKNLFDMISPMRVLLNYFFNRFFRIQNYFLYEKEEKSYKSVKNVGNLIRERQIPGYSFIHYDNLTYMEVEKYFPLILEKILKKSDFSFIFDELVGAKKDRNYPSVVSKLWSILEHIAQTYSRKRKKKKILTKEVLKKFRKIMEISIKKNLSQYIPDNSDINEIIDFFKNKINNSFPIKELIRNLCNDSDLEYNGELIKKIYTIRNKIEHETTEIDEILDSIKKDYKEPEFSFGKLIKISSNFIDYVEKLFLKFMGITPSILTYIPRSHTCNWNKQENLKDPIILEDSEFRKEHPMEPFSKEDNIHSLNRELKLLERCKLYDDLIDFINSQENKINFEHTDNPIDNMGIYRNTKEKILYLSNFIQRSPDYPLFVENLVKNFSEQNEEILNQFDTWKQLLYLQKYGFETQYLLKTAGTLERMKRIYTSEK